MTRPYILIGAGGTGSFIFPALIRALEAYYSDKEEDVALELNAGEAARRGSSSR